MNIAKKKLELIAWITTVQDESTIKKLEELKEESTKATEPPKVPKEHNETKYDIENMLRRQKLIIKP